MVAPVAKDSFSPEYAKRIAIFGKYAQLEFLGQGGMARVYKAHDPTLGRTVALKFVKTEDPHLTDRLLREARAQARIDQEHVCKIYETGEVEGKSYIAMQYIAGRTLKQLNDELSLMQKVNLIRQVCEGVHAAHKAGLIHRDLKPTNIMIEEGEADPSAYVMDFGLAREIQAPALTMTGLVVGTPSYMSPEQTRGQSDQVDFRTDIYSIGATLYEVSTGRPPFEGASSTEILMKVVGEEPTPPRKLQPTLSLDLQTIVLKCLEKNPDRRYTSVRALSDDLSRFLDGDPVLARPATWLYRANKKIRKHPVVAGLLAVAFLAVAIFGVTAGLIQWRAKEQAKLFQEFGEHVSEATAIMRYACLLPLHDTRPEKKQVLERLEQIRNRMQTLGSIAYGPGYYSIGRGYIALHRYQDAYDHLTRAWQQHHYREPSVANALGLTLAMLYQEKLREAESLYSKQQLVEQRAKLEKQYRDPALQYIQYAPSASEDPKYVKALIAFLEKRYDAALQQVETTEREKSWLYERKLLQGHILAAIGNDQRQIGKTDVATHFYQKAKAAYLEASKKGQSDPQVYEGLCSLQAGLLRMQMTQTAISPEPAYREGISYCDQALNADPEYVLAYLKAARAHLDWGYYQRMHGHPLKVIAEKAIQNARAILRMDPENPSAHLLLGNAYSSMADEEFEKQGNPVPYFDLADKSWAPALSKSPQEQPLLFAMGGNALMRGRFELNVGKDPRKTLDRASSLLEKAMAQSPKDPSTVVQLGTVYWTKARYEMDTGLDASSSLQSAIKLFRKSTDLNPSYRNGYLLTAAAYMYLADFQRDQGKEPISTIDQAIATYKKTLEIDPDNAYTLAGIGYSFWKKADWLHHSGKDPRPDMELARDALQKTIRFNKNLMECYSMYGEVELLAARYAIAKHQQPEQFFNKSETILNQALSLNPDAYESLGTLASLYVLQAEYGATLNRSMERQIQNGISAVDRAIALNAQLAETHATRGKLYLMKARSLSGIEKTKAAQSSKESYLQAIKVNGTVEKKYAAEIEEATLLSK